MKILVSICARAGSKGLPSKNIRPLLGKPLIAHTIEQALAWPKKHKVIFSTDGEEIAKVARHYGADVPFLRPEHLATDTIGKMPVLLHAFEAAEEHYKEKFDILVDLDPTSPIRSQADLDLGLKTFLSSGRDVCFSVIKARKNPYFNMVERNSSGDIVRVKTLDAPFMSRQAAPAVWDMNASIYVFSRKFLKSDPVVIWDGRPEIFEMPPESGFDIDLERDFVITESLMRHYESKREI